jgi:hypothetical protein
VRDQLEHADDLVEASTVYAAWCVANGISSAPVDE